MALRRPRRRDGGSKPENVRDVIGDQDAGVMPDRGLAAGTGLDHGVACPTTLWPAPRPVNTQTLLGATTGEHQHGRAEDGGDLAVLDGDVDGVPSKAAL